MPFKSPTNVTAGRPQLMPIDVLPGRGSRLMHRLTQPDLPQVIASVGAVQSSKTTYSIAGLFARQLLGRIPPGGLRGILSQSVSAADRNLSEKILAVDPSARQVQGGKEWLIAGHRWRVIGAPNLRAEHALRGSTWDVVLADEGSLYPEPVWRQLRNRARLIVTTANPEGAGHWFRAELRDPDTEVWKFTLFDNRHLSEARRDRIVRVNRQAGDHYYRRNVLGEWVSASGRIWHAVLLDHIPALNPVGWTVGVDFGMASPTAVVLVAWGLERATVVGELVLNPARDGQRTPPEQSRLISAWLWDRIGADDLPVTVFADPSAEALNLSLRRDAREHGRWPIRGADNDVSKGLLAVSSLFGEGRLRVVSEACPTLVTEIDGYEWRDDDSDRPAKANDHACDALRYAVYSVPDYWKGWVY